MILQRPSYRQPRGYTLVELLVAAAVLMMGAVVAFHMSSNAVRVEEMNLRLSRGLNLQENYSRTWQLGLSATQVESILPRSTEVTWTAAAANPTIAAVGPMEGLSLRATLNSGVVAGATRPNDVFIYRSTQ